MEKISDVLHGSFEKVARYKQSGDSEMNAKCQNKYKINVKGIGI
jgi:hypothetical protein